MADDNDSEEFVAIRLGEGSVLKGLSLDAEGGETVTAIQSAGDNSEVHDTDITNANVAFQNISGSAFINNSRFSGNRIGIESLEDTELTILRTQLENEIADLVYHDDVEIEVFESLAKDVLQVTRGSLVPIDVELNKQARQVLSSKSEDERRDAAYRLLKTGWDLTERTVTLRGAVALIQETTKYLPEYPF